MPQLAQRLEQYLDRRGPMSSAQGLTKAQRESRDIDKLRQLASNRRAPLLLWADLENLPEHRVSIEVRLFNARDGKSRKPEFGVCADLATEETLKELADAILTKHEQSLDLVRQRSIGRQQKAPDRLHRAT